MSGYFTERRRKLVNDFGGICAHCTSKSELEFAHVIPTKLSGKGRGMPQRIYDVLKHPLNYLLLCSNCHYKFDHSGKEKK